MKDMRTEFSKKVVAVIKAVPNGKVATYGLIASLAGNPQAARGVGWLLHSSTHKHRLPWQRIIKSSGHLSFPINSPKFNLQKQKLEAEGIKVINGKIDLKKFMWKRIYL